MNKFEIIGNLTADPTSASTNNGKMVTNFTVAVNDKRNRDKTLFVRVAAWYNNNGGGLGDVCAKYLRKGSKVYCAGTLTSTPYTDKQGNAHAGINLELNDMEMLSGKQETTDGNAPSDYGMTPVQTDDLPF